MAVEIIAEVGVNHNGDPKRALHMIDAAADAGVDVVKFQAYCADQLASRFAKKAAYQKKNTGCQGNQLKMLKDLELPRKIYPCLFKKCQDRGVGFLVTPFDLPSLKFLYKKIKVKRLKIPSGEITNAPYLLECSRTGLPTILSTGMATKKEIECALGILAFGYLYRNPPPNLLMFKQAFNSKKGQKILRKKVTLLHCTTEYPTPLRESNLLAIKTLEKCFHLPVGFSDHTEGIFAATIAVALGAKIIEKHFTLNRKLPGPDHKASLEPDELRQLVKSIRQAELALGNGIKLPQHSEIKNIQIARKSIVAGKDLKKGEIIKTTNIAIKRPGNGISPLLYWKILGLRSNQDYRKDQLIKNTIFK